MTNLSNSAFLKDTKFPGQESVVHPIFSQLLSLHNETYNGRIRLTPHPNTNKCGGGYEENIHF
jgi:hypothetical protein